MLSESPLGVLLTKWTIRLALVCYVAYLAGSITATSPTWPRIGHWIWTLGCGLFVVHVGCAFHFYHHWSHSAAWHSTAQETEQLIGVAFGDGIYFSYVFLVLWVFDVLWLWSLGIRTAFVARSATGVPGRRGAPSVRPVWRVWVHLFLFFIAFNGAIVFEASSTRSFGIVACCLLAALMALRGYNLYVQGPAEPVCEMIHEPEKPAV